MVDELCEFCVMSCERQAVVGRSSGRGVNKKDVWSVENVQVVSIIQEATPEVERSRRWRSILGVDMFS